MSIDLLHKALVAATKELEADHSWSFGADGSSSDYSGLAPEFLEVFYKHLSPLFNMSEINKQRIIQLRARHAAIDVELAELGAQILEGTAV